MEISRYIQGHRGMEWTKKTLDTIANEPFIPPSIFSTLSDTERAGIRQLCRSVLASDDCLARCDLDHLYEEERDVDHTRSIDRTSATRVVSATSQWDHLTPGSGLGSNLNSVNSRKTAETMETGELRCGRHTPKLPESGFLDETLFSGQLGWCIRRVAHKSGRPKYRLLFLDGTILVVDHEEDTVEYERNSKKDKWVY